MAWTALAFVGAGAALTGCGEGSVTAVEIDAHCDAVCACTTNSGFCQGTGNSSCVQIFHQVQDMSEDAGCESEFDDWFRCQADGDVCTGGGFGSPGCGEEQEDLGRCIEGGNNNCGFGGCDEPTEGHD